MASQNGPADSKHRECNKKNWPADQALYAVRLPGKGSGKGKAQGQFAIFAADGEQISTVYIWDTEPNGDGRVSPRGCDDQAGYSTNDFSV